MKPFWNWKFERALGAPPLWDAAKHGPCEALPIIRDEDQNEYISYWALSWRERWRILFGARVKLTVAGASHPPVSLEVRHP